MDKVFIGIDPGTRTGLAVWNGTKQKFNLLCTCGIVEAMKTVESLLNSSEFVVTECIIEDARKRKWFGANAQAKTQGAGSVKRDCSIWQELLTDLGAPCCFKPPAFGSTKLSKEHFAKLSGYAGQTSSHARDAAMLVLGKK